MSAQDVTRQAVSDSSINNEFFPLPELMDILRSFNLQNAACASLKSTASAHPPTFPEPIRVLTLEPQKLAV
jgi:hypothetical protein